jgi:hypothetical protein
MVSENDILGAIKSYVEHKDGQKFMLDFSQLAFNIHLCGSKPAIDLARRVEGKLAGVYCGHLSELVFRNWLRDDISKPSLVANNVSEAAWPAEPVNLAAVVEDQPLEWAEPSGRSLGVGFGSTVPAPA